MEFDSGVREGASVVTGASKEDSLMRVGGRSLGGEDLGVEGGTVVAAGACKNNPHVERALL